MKLPIYLDYSATTPTDPRVAEKMMECLTLDGNFGNPASRSHAFGWDADEAVENARKQVADLVEGQQTDAARELLTGFVADKADRAVADAFKIAKKIE